MMKARVGDHITVESERVGQPKREGEILEVFADGEEQHYLVRWPDGKESYIYPSAGNVTVTPRRAPAHSR